MRDRADINRQIGNRIRIAREGSHYTQAQLAERAETSSQYISDLERGVVGVSGDSLARICEALSVSADYLIFGGTKRPSMEGIVKKLEQMDDAQLSTVGEIIDSLLNFFSQE